MKRLIYRRYFHHPPMKYSVFQKLKIIGIILIFTVVGAAQNPSETDLPKLNDNYRIGSGDVLRITVVKQALLSADGVRVNNDGTIQLPMLDTKIFAACLTEAELSAELTIRYKKYLVNPQVYASVTAFNANQVAFIGAVNSPGRFQLQRQMRLLELLTFVNGPAPTAGKNIQIIRSPSNGLCELKVTADDAAGKPEQEVITLPLAEVLKGDDKSNPYIRAGDVIQIPEAEVVQAFVIGSVRSAMTVNLKEPVTLSQAIAMAGGTAQGANIEKVKIMRRLPGSLAKTEVIVNLKNINNRRQDDVLLEPNDIIDVPGESGTRKFLKDIFRTVVPVVTRVPVVIP